MKALFRGDKCLAELEGMTWQEAQAIAQLGTVYQRLGMPVDARREYDAALNVDSDHPVALAGRRELRLRGGDGGGVLDLRRPVGWAWRRGGSPACRP